MASMKAALYTDIREIQIQDVEYTPPESGYLTVDTRCTGICGSDLHNYFGEWKPDLKVAAGHEVCGVVAELGAGVTGFEIGDLVTMECFSHCGDCLYCRKGLYNHCLNRKWFAHGTHGGFAEYTTAHASSVFSLPDMSFEEGTLVEPLAVAHRALAQSGAGYQDRVVIIGGGTIGQLCLAVAKGIGVKEVMITVKYPHQAQLASDLGADHIIDMTQVDVSDAVKDHTNGMGMDVVIETIGGAKAFNESTTIVRKRGTVVLVAGYFEDLEVNLSRIVWSEAIITGSNCYGFSQMQTDFQAAIDLIAEGRIPLTKLVTHRYPLTEIKEAFRVAADKSCGAVKVHVVQDK
jgi:2-desacetyl-2-hydroxyethyl bacteriochlorophyllide A dehydrogenase